MTAAPQRLACQMTLTLLQNEFLSKVVRKLSLGALHLSLCSWLCLGFGYLVPQSNRQGSGDEKKATSTPC